MEAGGDRADLRQAGRGRSICRRGHYRLLIANFLAGPRKIERLVELRRKADPIISLVSTSIRPGPLARQCRRPGRRSAGILEVDIGLAGRRLAGQAAWSWPARRRAARNRARRRHGLRRALVAVEVSRRESGPFFSRAGQLVETAERSRPPAFALPDRVVRRTGSAPFAVSSARDHPEVQAGGVIFMDAFYRHKCHLDGFRITP